MRALISALVFLALSVALVSLLNQGNGYALFGYGEWTVEGSLALFILLDLLLFLALYLLLRALSKVWSMPERLQEWKKSRQEKRARNSLANGLLDLAAGKWKSAEQKLLKHVDASDRPLLNYLGAARTAQAQGAQGKRDNYLQLAYASAPSQDIAVTLTQAELQLSNGQMEQALATLMHLRQLAPRHSYVLKLLKDLYLDLESWSQLQQLLPELHKRDVIARDELHDLEQKIYVELLCQEAAKQDTEAMETVWRQAPKRLRSHGEMVLIYVEYLSANGFGAKAEQLLRDAISDNWDDGMVELYGLMEGANSARQLNAGESWLTQHQRSPVLLLALAHICLRGKLWGKARNYLEASIGAGPSAEAHQELGMLLEQMGEQELALDNFRAGLELASNGPAARSWRYDGPKSQDDSALERDTPALRQPMDAALPAGGETS
ncbi:MAG: heme biosynthesis protein HemY [Gammaproteobacteria bacterium]|nr:heme biosynthesis protein HemY [Gammaproteobacteria bacterium]